MNKDMLRKEGVFWSRLGLYFYEPPRMTRDGEPVVFTECDLENYLRYHKSFIDKGVKVHSCILHSGWVGEDEYDYALTDQVLDALMELDERILYIPRVKVNPPMSWMKKHPSELFCYVDAPKSVEELQTLVGTQKHDLLGYESEKGGYLPDRVKGDGPNIGGVISNQSLCSDKWKQDAEEAIRRLIDHLESKPYADRIVGYMFCFGPSGEIMHWGRASAHYGDYSKVALNKFYQYGLKKYGSREELAKNWNQLNLTEDTLVLPTPEERYWNKNYNDSLERLFRGNVSNIIIDYEEFLSDVVSQLVVDFGGIVKEKTDKIVGTFYGYIIECFNCNYAGHLALDKILNSPNVDFMAAPYTYRRRGDGEPSGEMSVAQSVNINKLWLDETDIRTHLEKNANGPVKSENLAGTTSCLWREACKNLSHKSGFWWMDLGNGWFDDDNIMKVIEEIMAFRKEIDKTDYKSASDILVVIDENSFYRMQPNEAIRTGFMGNFLSELRCSGTLVDVFRLTDLVNKDLSQYKLIIFAQTFVYNTEIFQKISIPKDATIMYNYTAGIWRDGKYAIENVEKMTGFALEEVENASDASYPNVKIVGTDSDISYKMVNGRWNIMNIRANIEASVLRDIARKAGCHIYSEENLVMYGDTRFLYILSKQEKEVDIQLKDKTFNYEYTTKQRLSSLRVPVKFEKCGFRIFTKK